jgi:pimeloyl-ACP methyl ester carboxylesterase
VMPLILEQASTGNLVPLAAQALTMLDSLDESLSYGMHNAVVCTEDAPFFDDFLRRELGRDALVDTYLGAEQLETLETMCETWPAGVLDEDFKSPVVSDHPVLVLSGSDDPITPPRNGERAIGANGEYLSNALHIVVPGQGHGVAGTGCLPRLVGAFVDQATVDELDTDCVDRLGPAAFFVDFATTAP